MARPRIYDDQQRKQRAKARIKDWYQKNKLVAKQKHDKYVVDHYQQILDYQREYHREYREENRDSLRNYRKTRHKMIKDHTWETSHEFENDVVQPLVKKIDNKRKPRSGFQLDLKPKSMLDQDS